VREVPLQKDPFSPRDLECVAAPKTRHGVVQLGHSQCVTRRFAYWGDVSVARMDRHEGEAQAATCSTCALAAVTACACALEMRRGVCAAHVAGYVRERDAFERVL